MADLPHARSFRELIVYQKQRKLALELFQISRRFPAEEKFSLTDQLRRACRSIGAQIAEAWAKRRYEKHFVAKLTDADAEQQETQHWVLSAHDCGYLSREEAKPLLHSCAEIGRMLQGMIEAQRASARIQRIHPFEKNPPSTIVRFPQRSRILITDH